MSIPNKQIGWSNESNLLWEVLFQLNKLRGNIVNACNRPSVTVSTNTEIVNFDLPYCYVYTFGLACNNEIKLPLIVNLDQPGDLNSYFNKLVEDYSWLGTFSLDGFILTLELNGNLAQLICPSGEISIQMQTQYRC